MLKRQRNHATPGTLRDHSFFSDSDIYQPISASRMKVNLLNSSRDLFKGKGYRLVDLNKLFLSLSVCKKGKIFFKEDLW